MARRYNDEDDDSAFCGRKVLQNIEQQVQTRRGIRGGTNSVRRRGRGIRTRGGLCVTS